MLLLSCYYHYYNLNGMGQLNNQFVGKYKLFPKIRVVLN